jgi:hypothetical protein
MTGARGKVGTASNVTIVGRKQFLECWKSTIMAHQVMQLLSPKGQVEIKIHMKRNFNGPILCLPRRLMAVAHCYN